MINWSCAFQSSLSDIEVGMVVFFWLLKINREEKFVKSFLFSRIEWITGICKVKDIIITHN